MNIIESLVKINNGKSIIIKYFTHFIRYNKVFLLKKKYKINDTSI